MKKFSLCFIMIVVFLFQPFHVFASSGAFLLMDGVTLDVLEGENVNLRLPMASTTKIMTALVVLETVELHEKVTIPREAEGVEGSSLYVKAGECYTVEELLYALMLQSANDCAVALAWFAGGENTEAFIDLMNAKAQEMGLKDTHFSNSSGLSAKDHYTTARELALIMNEAMKNQVFRTITATKKYSFGEKSVVNHNRLLHLYPDCIGGKTGYTMEAGRCLVTMAERDGVPLICVTLGRRDDWNIHTEAYEKWFAKCEKVTVAEQESYFADLPIAGGGKARAVNCRAVTATLIQFDGKISSRCLSAPFVYGNKAAGEVVGTVEFWYHETKIGESPLVLTAPIEVAVKKELFISRIFRFFRRLFLKNK